MGAANRLHSKWESRAPQPGQLYSLMDLMGCVATCDDCGNWQRIPAINEASAKAEAEKLGWIICEKDLCPRCVAAQHNPDKVERHDV